VSDIPKYRWMNTVTNAGQSTAVASRVPVTTQDQNDTSVSRQGGVDPEYRAAQLASHNKDFRVSDAISEAISPLDLVLGGSMMAGARKGLEKLAGRGVQAVGELAVDAGKVALREAVSKPVGRVVTNLVEPHGYGLGAKLRKVDEAGPWGIVKAIVQDKPIYPMGPREPLYREMFGLKPRAFEDVYTKSADGTWDFARDSPHPVTPAWERPLSGQAQRDLALYGNGGSHPVLGGFEQTVTPAKGGRARVGYEDVWDFAQHPNEKFSDIPKLRADEESYYYQNSSLDAALSLGMRKAMNAITTPVTVRGAGYIKASHVMDTFGL